MDTLFPQKSDFISTKEAARLSSYHSDYLARLAKQNKIIGRQVGRTWLISWSSLERFAAEQESRKRARAGALSSERRSHYRAANAPSLPAPIGISADPPRPRPRPLVSPWSSLARSRLLALAVTCALLGASAAASAAPALPAFGAHAAALAVQSARGFSLLADEALAPVAARVAAAHAQERSASERAYARAQSVGGAPLAFGLAAPQLPRAPLALASPASPATSAREVPHAALSPSVRTLLAQAPQAVAAMNLALGEGVIAAAHGAIALEVRGIYATPGAARASARATTLALGDTGAALAFAAAQAPGVASALSAAGRRAAIALGESAAREFFGAEYALAERFLAVRDAALAADWQATWGAGALAAQGTLALSAAAAHLDAPAAEDLALGLLGRAAAALEAGSDRLAAAAALPSLSPLQKVALATYEYFNAIFAPPPGVAVVENATTTPAPIAIAPAPAAPAAAPAPRPVTLSYPSYTTVVNGVSQSYVDQAIATATNELEARMALLVAPVAAQSVVNETSIQEVNMIQSLSGLTVNDGTWNGGAISGATVDATALHADTAGIGLLSAGTTTLSGTIDATGYLLNGVPLSGSGTVTSVDADGGATGLTFSGGPVTTSGTLTLGGTLAVAAGGTGTSTAPGYGQLLLGNGAGGFDYVATSSLGIVGGSGSGILTGLGSGYATTTGAAITFATSSSAATGLTLGLSIVPAASSLAFNPSLGGTLAVAHGGTGTSSAPGYGQLLLGNGAGGFDYVATSSLGITAGTSFTANYPLALNAGVLSLAFGTSTSNTWGGTQIFTNAPILGSLTGLIYGSSGALHTAATSTAALGPGLSGTLTTLGAGDSLSIATSSLFGGSTGQVAYFSGADSIAGTSSITVAASGNVGVGTAAPTYPFEVDSATTNTALFLSSSNTLTDVAVKNSSAGGRDWQLLSIGANGFNSMTAGSFAIHDNSSGATRFDISPGGDIGIGTTSPFAKLSVAGSGYFDGALTSGNLTATGTVAFTGLGSGLVKSASGTLGLAADGTDYLSPSTLGGLFYDLFHATTTNALAEGSSNLYFTNARADARFITDLAATSSVSSI
ncbi:MAG TPA: hypothetical protein VHC68_03005, partial [Candidatus Paceibacterota bacterium]|nr:hypothetical protein [Candidatus Paceibacterota bacterium]